MFNLSDEQEVVFDRWLKKHNKKCKFKKKIDKKRTVTGVGRLTYCFTPTGIGDIVVVKCGCGEEIDLTDINTW